MAQTTSAAPQPVAATIQELENLAGADPQFIVEQLKANSTLQQATNALNVRLAGQLEEMRNRVANAQPPAARGPVNPSPVPPETDDPPTPPQPQPQPRPQPQPYPDDPPPEQSFGGLGVAALANNNTPGLAQQTSPHSGIFNHWERRFKQLVAEGVSADDAWRQMDKEMPQYKLEILAGLGEPAHR